MFPLNCLYFSTVIRLLICAPTNAGAHWLLGGLVKCGFFKKTVLKRLVSANYYNSPVHNKEYNEYCIVSHQGLTENGKNKLKRIFLYSMY